MWLILTRRDGREKHVLRWYRLSSSENSLGATRPVSFKMKPNGEFIFEFQNLCRHTQPDGSFARSRNACPSIGPPSQNQQASLLQIPSKF